MAKTAVKEPEQDNELISIRFKWPPRVHAKIRKHQRQLSVDLDRHITFEEASIDYIDGSEYLKKKS